MTPTNSWLIPTDAIPLTIPKCCGRVISVSPLAIKISRYSLPVLSGNLSKELLFWALELPISENDKMIKVTMRVAFIGVLIKFCH